MANRLKEALQKKKILIGMQVFSGSPTFVEILGLAGFDWVSIDMEHSPITFETVLQMTRTADAAGIIPLVRVAENDPGEILHALDAGAAGVIVPHVNTPEELERVVQACRYPPDGIRGTCTTVRGARYGFEPWNTFYKKLNQDVIVVPLIEERQAVENFDGMVAVEGVNIFWVGISDLGQSYGLAGASFEHPVLQAAAKEVIAKATKAGKAVMAPVAPLLSLEYARELIDMGFKLLSFGTDISVFRRSCQQIAADIAAARGRLTG